MKRYFTTVFQLAFVLTRRFMRDPVALFFTFLFPLLFLVVFGFLFRSSDVSFDVVVINHSKTQFAKQFISQTAKSDIFKIKKDVRDVNTAKERMGRGEVDSIIELPKTFGALNSQGVPSGDVVIYYDRAEQQTGQTVANVMQGVLDGINKELTKTGDPLNVKQKPTNTSSLSQFDYIFSGLLGFSILSLGIFGLANNFPADKKTGALRRLRATPLKASQLILATLIEYTVVGLLSLAVMFIVALLFFRLQYAR